MKKILVAIICIIFYTWASRADTCGAGYYYNENNECVVCQKNHYCTGDGTMQPCPAFTYDSTEELKPLVTGYNAHSVGSAGVYTQWVYSNYQLTDITKCVLVLYNVETDQGRMNVYGSGYSQQTNTYSRKIMTLWNRANNGYYLSSYRNGHYYTIKACTNSHPTNSHYSGPGTPDSADGTVVDANDCPWACDDGYYGSSVAGDNSCTLCDVGYYCTNGTRTACYYDQTTGRYTYSNTAGATSCTVCPAVTGALVNRVQNYNYWTSSNIHSTVTGCAVYFSDDDPTGTYRIECYYNTTDNAYGGPNGSCYTHAPTSCIAGYGSSIAQGAGWSAVTGRGVDNRLGNVCVLCATGYDSPDGSTTCTPNTITIEWAGADGTYETSSCIYGGGFNTPATPPTKRGHVFAGWTFTD